MNTINEIATNDFLSQAMNKTKKIETKEKKFYEEWLCWPDLTPAQQEILANDQDSTLPYTSAIYIGKSGIGKTYSTLLLIKKCLLDLHTILYAQGKRRQDLTNAMHNYSPLFYSHNAIVALSNTLIFGSGDEKYIARLQIQSMKEATVLVIDDFSTKKVGGSGFSDNKIDSIYYDIFNYRYDNKENNTTIITSNDSIEIMESNESNQAIKTISRMLGAVNNNIVRLDNTRDKRIN